MADYASVPVPSPGLVPNPTPNPAPLPTSDPAEREFVRAENEDDDGYDPWSDRRPAPEPLFEPDPWN